MRALFGDQHVRLHDFVELDQIPVILLVQGRLDEMFVRGGVVFGVLPGVLPVLRALFEMGRCVGEESRLARLPLEHVNLGRCLGGVDGGEGGVLPHPLSGKLLGIFESGERRPYRALWVGGVVALPLQLRQQGLPVVLHVFEYGLARGLWAHFVNVQRAEYLHVGQDHQLVCDLGLQGLEVLLAAPATLWPLFADDLWLRSPGPDLHCHIL